MLYMWICLIPKVRVKFSPNPKWFNPAICHTITNACTLIGGNKYQLRPTPHNLSKLQSLLYIPTKGPTFQSKIALTKI